MGVRDPPRPGGRGLQGAGPGCRRRLFLLLRVMVVVDGGERRQPLGEAGRDFGGRHHRGGSKRGSGSCLKRGVRVSGAQVRGERGGRGPRQALRGRPGFPHAGVQNVCDAEGGFLDRSGIQREGAASRAGRGAVSSRPEAEVGGVEGSQPGGEHPGGVRPATAEAWPDRVDGWVGAPGGTRGVQEEAAAQPRTICFRFSVRTEERPGSPSATEGGGEARIPAGLSRPRPHYKGGAGPALPAGSRRPRGAEATRRAGAVAPHTPGKPGKQGPGTERKTQTAKP